MTHVGSVLPGRLRSRRLQSGLAVIALATGAALVAAPGGAHAAAPKPSVRLVSGVTHLELDRFGTQPQLYLNDVAFLAATRGTFELRATRAGGGVQVAQIERIGGKTVVLRQIHPDGNVSMIDGLPNFFQITLRTTAGTLIDQQKVKLCPTAGGDGDVQRISPRSVDNPTFPQSCGDTLTRVTPWGIDAGWAEGVSTGITVGTKKAPDGIYSLRVALAPTYAHQLHVPASAAAVNLTVHIVSQTGGCPGVCPIQQTPAAAEAVGVPVGSQDTENVVNVPVTGHHTELLPDLESLPAHDLSIDNHKSGTSILGFGATIWNRGPGVFDIEGFRQGAHPKMLARQYIDRPGKSPKIADIGHFEFDTRQGHHHWHLEDVAQYSLLDHTGTNIIRSEKQSFCLAPTDPINLLRPGSTWNPNSIGLESACPTDEGLWLRETLPVGWGDTYYQSVAGQAFNITGLANGTYYLQIRANPFGAIHEVSKTNDTSYLKITLGGTSGARTFTVIKPVSKP